MLFHGAVPAGTRVTRSDALGCWHTGHASGASVDLKSTRPSHKGPGQPESVVERRLIGSAIRKLPARGAYRRAGLSGSSPVSSVGMGTTLDFPLIVAIFKTSRQWSWQLMQAVSVLMYANVAASEST